MPIDPTSAPAWRGTLTALVTPMAKNGEFDGEAEAALTDLVQRQIEAGIDGLVVCGTTGEAATLTSQERSRVIGCVVRAAQNRVPVMAGVGTQDTASTCQAITEAQAAGAQGLLVVTPFYNKPSQEGLKQHFERVAGHARVPVMLYNVPSRTGVDLLPATVAALAQHPNIVGIKEATGSLGRLDALRAVVPDNFDLVSGDDGTACAFAAMGGHGVISVTSNLVPEQMAALVAAGRTGDVTSARRLQLALAPLIEALFIEPNPLPIKTALAWQGHMHAAFRLPLCAMGQETQAVLRRAMQQAQLLP